MNIAELLSSEDLLVGVDISERRMELCQALFRKNRGHLYTTVGAESHQPRVILCLADGTAFGPAASGQLVFDTSVSIDCEMVAGTRKRRNKSVRGRERKLLKSIENSELKSKDGDGSPSIITEFDAVFVDAECTHDGSFRHLSECENSAVSGHIGAETDGFKVLGTAPNGFGYNKKMASDKYEARDEEAIASLQKRLIQQGFRVLKPGGTLVYSTCSLSRNQNEDVVKYLIDKASDAVLENIFDDCVTGDLYDDTVNSSHPTTIQSVLQKTDDELNIFFGHEEYESTANDLSIQMCAAVAGLKRAPCLESAILPGTVQFNRHCGTSGLFVSRIRKIVL